MRRLHRGAVDTSSLGKRFATLELYHTPGHALSPGPCGKGHKSRSAPAGSWPECVAVCSTDGEDQVRNPTTGKGFGNTAATHEIVRRVAHTYVSPFASRVSPSPLAEAPLVNLPVFPLPLDSQQEKPVISQKASSETIRIIIVSDCVRRNPLCKDSLAMMGWHTRPVLAYLQSPGRFE